MGDPNTIQSARVAEGYSPTSVTFTLVKEIAGMMLKTAG